MGLFSRKKKSAIFDDKELLDAGACPNCWGNQEYDQKVRVLLEEKQIDVNNNASKHAFIKDFVVNHVEGIHVHREDDHIVCSHCKKTF